MIQLDSGSARIGIDLGGTKIEMVAVNDSGDVIEKVRVPTPQGDYQGTIEAIAKLIQDFEKASNVRASVGIGMPGALSRVTGRVKNANSVCLNGMPFKEDIENALERSVRIENDANCFVLSEATDGAAAGASIVFGVILGTGVGGGVVINGKLVSGPNAITGEWGHNPLPWPDEQELVSARTCYCGKRGCIETWLCGEGFRLSYEVLTGLSEPPPKIADRASKGHEAARKALDSYCLRLAKSLATVINLLDPDVIVLGGGLSNIDCLYSTVPELWRDFVFSDHVYTKLVRAQYGDASGVRGAVWL